MEQNKCNKCGRPMQYATEPKCNYCDSCMSEYCGCKLGRIKEIEPTCGSTAVIPSITVESVEGITNLANCLVHVNDINTTFYVDDKHRVMITWAGPVDIPGYDMKNNPNGYRDQIVTDVENETAVIYDKHGNGYLFGITPENLQTAIDNKLDEMAIDGTLENIIATYMDDVIHTFDTVADMKNSTELTSGAYAQTLGFHSLNDGGGALYKITNTGTANEMNVITIGTTLYANLMIGDTVFAEQFGAYGDNIHDDQDMINAALSSSAKTIRLSKGKTYLIKGYETGQSQGGTPAALTGNTGLVVPSHTTFDLNSGTIKIIANDRSNYNGITVASVDNVIIENGNIIGDRQTHTGSTGEWGYGVSLRYANNVKLTALNISECWGDGINISNDGVATDVGKNILVENCVCDSNRRQGMSIENGENIKIVNSKFTNTGNNSLQTNPGAGVDIEPYANSGNIVKNLVISNCIMSGNYSAGIASFGIHTSGAKVDGVTIEGCIIKDNQKGTNDLGSISVVQSRDVRFVGNSISNDDVKASIILRPENPIIFDSNKVKNGMVLINSAYLNNSYVKIINNEFYNNIQAPYNGIIECVSTSTSNNNNTLYVVGNDFTLSNSSLNIQSIIIDNINSKFTCAKISNNTFNYGRRAIEGNASFIINGNVFRAQYEYVICLATDNSSQITEVSNNVFEAVNFNNSETGLIWNQSKINTVLQNNNYYDFLLNGESLTVSHKPNKMLQYSDTTGISVAVNNNFNTTS